MRNLLLATAAVSLGLVAAPVTPASAGYYGHHGYYYTYELPPPVVYKHYLPDEDDFGPVYGRYYVPRYTRHYYPAPVYTRHSHSSGCAWLKRRAIHTGSRYWWNRYHDCVDD